MALTKRQREILEFLTRFIAQEGYSPSLEEIAAHFDLSSVATVHKHVQHLLEKGLVRKVPNSSRSVEPVGFEEVESHRTEAEVVALPLLGEVAAGVPIEAIEQAGEIVVPVSIAATRGRPLFALRVRGDSMIDEQIRDGDYVVVESRVDARQGETVVVLIHGEEATLKKFYREGPVVRLVPANSSLQPMVFPAEEVEIRGVVRGLIRSY